MNPTKQAVTPGEENIKFTIKSGGTMTGNFIIGAGHEDGFLAGVSKKVREVDENADTAIALSAVALVISIAAFFIAATHSLLPET